MNKSPSVELFETSLRDGMQQPTSIFHPQRREPAAAHVALAYTTRRSGCRRNQFVTGLTARLNPLIRAQ